MTLPYYPLYLSLLLSVCLFNTPVLSFIIPTNRYHVGIPNSHQIIRISSTQRYLFGGVGGGAAKIPTSPSARDNDAISSIKSAIGKPRNTSCKLIECEFPALQQINKLGDGSLRSSIEAEDANVAFVNKLYNSLERGTVKSSIAIPFIGPDVTVVLSSSASNALINKVQKKIKGATLFSLKEGIPQMADKKGVYVFLTPSSPKDYQAAKTLTEYGCTAVLVNGLFKDQKSIPSEATMGYFVKPLTYNSQVAGYLIRAYPSLWTVLDSQSKAVLGSFSDEQILVDRTNTPDLRESGRLVQKSVDERAIKARG